MGDDDECTRLMMLSLRQKAEEMQREEDESEAEILQLATLVLPQPGPQVIKQEPTTLTRTDGKTNGGGTEEEYQRPVELSAYRVHRLWPRESGEVADARTGKFGDRPLLLDTQFFKDMRGLDVTDTDDLASFVKVLLYRGVSDMDVAGVRQETDRFVHRMIRDPTNVHPLSFVNEFSELTLFKLMSFTRGPPSVVFRRIVAIMNQEMFKYWLSRWPSEAELASKKLTSDLEYARHKLEEFRIMRERMAQRSTIYTLGAQTLLSRRFVLFERWSGALNAIVQLDYAGKMEIWVHGAKDYLRNQ